MGEDKLGTDHAERFAVAEIVTRKDTPEVRIRGGFIPRDTIARLIEQLELRDPDPLIDRLWEVAGRHLRPAHRLLNGSDPASTRKLLISIANEAEALRGKFDTLAPVVISFLTEFHASLPPSERSASFPDIDGLDRLLGELALLCAKGSNELIQAPNAPLKALLRQTLRDAAATIELHTGRTVKTLWSRKDSKCYEFKGVEGKVLFEFMGLVEPGVVERSLVVLFREMREKHGRKPQTPEN